MTHVDFTYACNERFIDQGVAEENELLLIALKRGDDQEVLRLLDEEF